VSFGLEIRVVIAEKELAEGVMIDTSTGDRLIVSTEGDGGPFIELPLSQVDEVRKRLDQAGIPYWVDSMAISINGEPPMAVIEFSRYVDAGRIQSALDDPQ
jgi:hypothetical protein